MQIVLQVATDVAQSATDDPTTKCAYVNVRRLGGVCGQGSSATLDDPKCVLSLSRFEEANHERPRSVSADHQRLFDVGRLRWPGNECSEAGRVEAGFAVGRALEAFVGGVHVVDDRLVGYDQDQMLAKEEQHAQRHGLIGYPNSRVFCHREFGRKNRDVNICQIVRGFDRRGVDVAETHACGTSEATFWALASCGNWAS